MLPAPSQGNGYQAIFTFHDDLSMSSAENYSSMADTIIEVAVKLLDMPKRLETLFTTDILMQLQPPA